MVRVLLLVTIMLLSVPALCAQGYRIGHGDTLKVFVWDVPDISTTVTVRPDGMITLPGIGDVSVVGKTPSAVAEELNEMLLYLVRKPMTTVTVEGITNNKIYVTGAGVDSRVLSLSGPTMLFKVLAGIGSLEHADLRRATVVRDNQEIYSDFHPLYIDGDLSRNLELRAEDVIFIPSSKDKRVYITGEVTSPKTLRYQEKLTLLDAILLAGGFTPQANKGGVMIKRDGATVVAPIKDDSISEGTNTVLKEGDHIVVPSYKNDKVYVAGAVNAPRFLLFSPGLRVLDAIYSAGGFNDYAKKSAVVILHADGKRVVVDLKRLMKAETSKDNVLLNPGDYIIVEESIF